jgi:hypothetical protein
LAVPESTQIFLDFLGIKVFYAKLSSPKSEKTKDGLSLRGVI